MNNINNFILEMKKGKLLVRTNGKDCISSNTNTFIIKSKTKKEFIDSNVEYYKNGTELFIKPDMESIKLVGTGSGDVFKVKYYFFNPQCNRCFAKLENGKVIDHSPDLIDFIYNNYKIVDKDYFDEIQEVTMEDVYRKFGRYVKIVDKPKVPKKTDMRELETGL